MKLRSMLSSLTSHILTLLLLLFLFSRAYFKIAQAWIYMRLGWITPRDHLVESAIDTTWPGGHSDSESDQNDEIESFSSSGQLAEQAPRTHESVGGTIRQRVGFHHRRRNKSIVMPSSLPARNLVPRYAQSYGFSVEMLTTHTQDGFKLHVDRIWHPSHRNHNSCAVLLQHGLFQSGGVYVCNEKRSLAFYLACCGFDVFISNNRCIFPEDSHVKYSPDDDEYWNWTIDDLARYDFPALIDLVNENQQIPGEKIVYIGHSQGSTQGVVGLCMHPELADKLHCFVALAPAVFVGPPTNWVLKMMGNMSWMTFQSIFTRRAFIPLMNLVRVVLPRTIFATVAYSIFSYLFQWGDKNWCSTRKRKYFSTTPTPVSCKLIYHWSRMLGFGQIYSFPVNEDTGEPRPCVKYAEQLHRISCPMSVIGGGADILVDTRHFLDELREEGVDVVPESTIVHGYEHMDVIWADDAPSHVFPLISKAIRRCKGRSNKPTPKATA